MTSAPGTARLPVGPRGLSKEAITRAAVELMEELGEGAFSLRKLGERVGCDPMAILYHFRNKDGLYRAMADAITAELPPVDQARPWNDRLRQHARDYRTLALGHPHTFALTQKFLNTGVSDFAHIEMVHGALKDAGVPDTVAPTVCLAWYASVIGLCMAEIGGLIRPAQAAEIAEIERLPLDRFPNLRQLATSYGALDAEIVFEIASDMMLEGIHARTR
ncbi:TetR/AcrR family transcriptional regulator [Pseudogemmobacter sonorensis]|uniref:TetR/AcrR family transcriptional regulator n=1 Tax=Pseudogemmobacter sonorensis TaxID=2989681 RepID=UPI00368ECEE3